MQKWCAVHIQDMQHMALTRTYFSSQILFQNSNRKFTIISTNRRNLQWVFDFVSEFHGLVTNRLFVFF